MATDLKLNNSHDLDISGGDLQLATEKAEIAQAIKIALLTVQGEWVYDAFLGLPWFGDMFQHQTTRTEIVRKLRTRISEVPGILKINNVNLTVDDAHVAQVVFDIDTIYGIVSDEVYL